MKLTFEDRQRLGQVLTGYVASLECRVAQDAAKAAQLARKWRRMARLSENQDGDYDQCAAELESAFNIPKP